MQCINWSCIFWRPSLCIVLLQAQKQITNKYTETIAGFFFFLFFAWYFSGEDFAKFPSMPVLLAFYMGSVDGIRILL
jgi:hypothetical protein